MIAGATASRYADARHAYVERTAHDIRSAIAMRRLALVLASALALAMLVDLVLATSARFVPVYIHDNARGEITFVGREPERNSGPSSAAIRAQLGDWIANAREISSDPMANRERQRRVAALVLSGSPAQTFLRTYYQHNDLMALAYEKRVAVALSFVAPIGASSLEYEAEWTEETRDPDGRQLGPPKRFRGRLAITLVRLGDEAAIYMNPLGLLISDLTWSEKVH